MFDTQHLGGTIVALTTIPFLLVVGGLLISVVRTSRKGHVSQTWPTTPGRIVASQVSNHRLLNSNGTHTTMYEPDVSFVYAVGAQQYTSNNVSFSSVAGTSWSSGAEDVVARYPPGANIMVWYNPENPSEATLEQGGAGGGLNVLLLGVLGSVEVLMVVLLALGLTGHFD